MKTYYVSVQAQRIMERQGDGPYEFEIIATKDQIDQLNEIFEKMKAADHMSYWSSHIPYIPYHEDPQNDAYDLHLKKAYRMIYELGTEETKQHIESMNILD